MTSSNLKVFGASLAPKWLIYLAVMHIVAKVLILLSPISVTSFFQSFFLTMPFLVFTNVDIFIHKFYISLILIRNQVIGECTNSDSVRPAWLGELGS